MMQTDKYMRNMETTTNLFEAGVAMMRENIRRRHANASSQTVDALLGAWMRREDDPIPGDTIGTVRFQERLE